MIKNRDFYSQVHAMRLQMQDRASHLLREYDEKTLRLRDLEDTLQRTGAKEYDEDANMKVIQDMHRDALYREETSRLYVQKLKRLIEIKQGIYSSYKEVALFAFFLRGSFLVHFRSSYSVCTTSNSSADLM